MVLVLFLLQISAWAKDPVRIPGYLQVEDLINATSVSLPSETTLSCDTAEISYLTTDTLLTSYMNSDTVQVYRLLAKDSEIRFNGKLNITGSVTYSSKVQIGLKKFRSSQTRFLQKFEKDWQEFKMLWVKDSATLSNLPEHEFLQVVGNCHCETGSSLLKVDDKVQWMENCQGTSHVSSVVDHQGSEALISFVGCLEIGAVWVYFK